MIVCVVLSLEYIHAQKIIHRDIKPDNLVFCEQGYLHLTDFGIAREKRKNNNRETSGTPGYMAPEVMMRKNHSFEVDYYSVGVTMYEIITGRRPYRGRTKKDIENMMKSKQVKLQRSVANEYIGWTDEALDFCNQLIQRRASERLGYEGIDEVRDHPWLKGVRWGAVLNKLQKPPFSPVVISFVKSF